MPDLRDFHKMEWRQVLMLPGRPEDKAPQQEKKKKRRITGLTLLIMT
jgi:hypothetical protein